MTLLEEIRQKCTPEEIASGNFHIIAGKVNVNRTVPKKTSIGEGTILEVLGITAGNAFLDVIDTVPDYRHVKKIIARGDFDMSTAISQAGVQALVPAVLTQEQADALMNLGKEPSTVSWEQCRAAVQGA